jgi:hypothetical protein
MNDGELLAGGGSVRHNYRHRMVISMTDEMIAGMAVTSAPTELVGWPG